MEESIEVVKSIKKQILGLSMAQWLGIDHEPGGHSSIHGQGTCLDSGRGTQWGM